MIYTDPLRDMQQQPPVGWCARCGCELYQYDDAEVCQICKEELDDERGTGSF